MLHGNTSQWDGSIVGVGFVAYRDHDYMSLVVTGMVADCSGMGSGTRGRTAEAKVWVNMPGERVAEMGVVV